MKVWCSKCGKQFNSIMEARPHLEKCQGGTWTPPEYECCNPSSFVTEQTGADKE